ncbi:SAF domain-containing protein [Kribbella sp. NPDC051770]|uniref:SAF domain-containing protein n=1 Tax=Kribbella sp. NPDC051770 TaxID=3155413 RepID=UPI00341BA723
MTNFWHDLIRAARWHRRLLAGLFAAAAVYFGLASFAPPAAASAPVLAAARDLPGGITPTPGDLRTLRLPPAAVPSGALQPGADLSQRILATPVRSGEPLTDARFLTPTAVPAGLVAYPLRLDDPDIAALLRPGDHVDLYAASATAAPTATALATAARILALPAPTRSAGALLVLATTPSTAARLAQSTANSKISVALTPDTS